jgi:general secretion pathway protein B
LSLILDALRKSETQRQQLGGVSLADLPQGKRSSPPWWLYGVGVLLLANAILLLVVLFRPASNPSPVVAASTAVPTPANTVVTNPAPSSSIAPAPQASELNSNAQAIAIDAQSIQSTPLADATLDTPPATYEEVDRSVMDAASRSPDGPTLVRPTAVSTRQDQASIDLMTSSAPSSVPSLHLDMHVYAPDSKGRFVFINGRKYIEGQKLSEGPTLEAIVPEGVILNLQGTRWRQERP